MNRDGSLVLWRGGRPARVEHGKERPPSGGKDIKRAAAGCQVPEQGLRNLFAGRSPKAGSGEQFLTVAQARRTLPGIRNERRR